MRPDFSLIWGADNAPFTPIEASDYTAGWVFRTGAPPRRVNFDYFQNLSDQRTAWLGEQMLLTVGHEWQPDVTYDTYAIVRSPINDQLYRSLVGGNIGNEPSASAAQWEKDYSNTLAKITKITSSGTYTPSPGVKFAIIEAVGGGGGGGGTVTTGGGGLSVGGGGASGGYAKTKVLVSDLSPSKTVVIGAPGVGVSGANGSTGGTTEVSGVISVPGGGGGVASPQIAAGVALIAFGGDPGATPTSTVGEPVLLSSGLSGGIGANAAGANGGPGAGSPLFGGGGGAKKSTISDAAGNNATSFGGGGGGACADISTAAKAGGSGAPGVVIIWEYR